MGRKLDLSRREFCRVAGALAGLAALPRCSSSPSTATSALPSLGGAPDTHEGHTIAAFCDTVVPGRWRDPEGTPGALDTNAPALFFDPTLPALPYVGLLVILLDGYAGKVRAGAQFVDLVPDERDAAVAAAIDAVDLMYFAVELAKLAHFSSSEAGTALGYPGPNPGYWNDPDFSFNRPMSREITVDGNYP